MGKPSADLTNDLRIALAGTSCLFTNVRGLFLTLDGRRKVPGGLQMAGASDQIGFTPIVITQAMVGRTMAVFTAMEVKAGNDTLKPDQRKFIQNCKAQGAIAGVIRNPEDGAEIVNEYIDNRHTVPVLYGVYSDGESNDNS